MKTGDTIGWVVVLKDSNDDLMYCVSGTLESRAGARAFKNDLEPDLFEGESLRIARVVLDK